MKKQNIIMLLLLATIPLSPITILPRNASAVYETKLKVEPVENIFYTNTTTVGQTFDVSIIVENVLSFYGWELELVWTPGVINCTAQNLNTNIWPYYGGPWVTVPIDNVKGEYHQALTGKSPSTPVDGTFWLVNLTFQIVQAPPEGMTLETDLTIEPAPGFIYCLLDQLAGEIPHEFINGIYKFISPRPPLPEIKLKVAPPAILNPSLIPSETFNVSITITNTVYLHGFSLKLGYNSTTIECIAVYEGDLLKSFGATTMTYLINNTAEYAFVSINLTAPEAMADGDGTLATFEFHVLNIGDSVLHLYETQLYDSEFASLPHTISDGYFNNILMPILYVDPPLIVNPNMNISSMFEININVANVSDLYDFEFKLLYDTDVLNGLGILVYPFNNETSFELDFTLNDTLGEIWVRVQYHPPAEPVTSIPPLTLVKVFFQVQSYGATLLTLSETELSNSLGLLIDHITRDGYVSILRRDVAIISVVPDLTEAYKGWTVNITVVAKNLGDIPESFNVTVYCNDHEVKTQEVMDLATNDTATLVFVFDTLQTWVEPCHNYTIKAVASQVPYEIDIANNVLKDDEIHIKLMGDINGDGYVNALDSISVGAAFGSKEGDDNWNEQCDLKRDGFINAKDIVLLGSHFGESCYD